MSTLLVDNYDSFSYNLYQLIGSLDSDIKVVRNDELTPEQIMEMHPDRIVISPGPGKPEDAGICVDLVTKVAGRIPILGVCLGHQAICVSYGATVTYAEKLMHGKSSEVSLDNGSPLFKGMGPRTVVARYHSLAADPKTIPPQLKVTSVTDSGDIMAVEDPERKVFGVQFHPESVLTPEGRTMIANFMEVRI